MKKLMLAASAAAFSAVSMADVYNVKFTATTTVGAEKKGVEYLKKGSVVVDGLYDTETAKYYFWTGKGATMAPMQKAIFEAQNAVDMDSAINGKNVALNAGLYAGEEGALETAFIAAGLGKVLTVGGDDLNSASGSFAGKYEGKPAYGTWAFSKNSSASKMGVDAYINNLSKKNLTVADWGDNSELKGKLDAWRDVAADAVANAEQVKKDLEEIAGLKTDLEDKTLNVKELEDTKLMLENDIGRLEAALADKTLNVKELENTKLELENAYGALEKVKNELDAKVAEQDKTIADQKSQLDNANAELGRLDGAFDQLNNNETVKVLEDFLKDGKADQQGIADDAALTNATLASVVADYKAKKEAFAAIEGECAELKAAADEAKENLEAAKQAVADAIAKTNYLVSVKDKSYYQNKQNEIDAQQLVVNQATADRDALINGYIAQTNAILTQDWSDYEDKLVGETNNWTTILNNAIAAQAAAQQAYEASDFVKYTTENGEADWAKWLKDNDLEVTTANLLLFHDNVYPAMLADGKAKKLALDTADAELAKAKKAYDAKVPGYVEILDLLAKGEADAYISDLLKAAKEAYDYNWAVANKEVEKAQAKLDDLEAEYDAAFKLAVSDAMIAAAELDIADAERALEAAKKAYTKAQLAYKAKLNEKKAAKGEVDLAAAAIEAILGVNPEVDMAATSEAEKEFYAKFDELRDVALANVAAADALLARMAK